MFPPPAVFLRSPYGKERGVCDASLSGVRGGIYRVRDVLPDAGEVEFETYR